MNNIDYNVSLIMNPDVGCPENYANSTQHLFFFQKLKSNIQFLNLKKKFYCLLNRDSTPLFLVYSTQFYFAFSTYALMTGYSYDIKKGQ